MTQTDKNISHADIETNKWIQLGKLTAGIAHELNIPVTGMVSFSSICLKGIETHDLEKVTRGLNQMQLSIQYINVLVQRLLMYARGNPKQITTSFSISEILDMVITLTTPQVTQKKIMLCHSAHPDCRPLVGDPTGLTQVLINFVVNATHAITHDNGKIEVTVKQHPLHLEIQVSDNGCGIPSDILPSIFDYSFSTKTDPFHLGFGLPISKEIIQTMGGSIVVDSTVGSGTTFSIQFPN